MRIDILGARLCNQGLAAARFTKPEDGHFVTPADIRWMLALTAPRVKAAMASYDRKLGLDARRQAAHTSGS